MSWDQELTLILAVYGAVLSTLLAFREWWNGRKRILIRLDYVAFLEMAEITITNVGYRPITITGVEIHPEGSDMVPSNSLLSTRASPTQPLPATLNDGDHLTLPLSDNVSGILLKNGMRTYIGVHDAEGRTYSKHKTGKRNPKWGYFGTS
jgi:hypothetical protein